MRRLFPSPAMAVALIALGIALGGSAVAGTGLITGAQIKDHSIGLNDLSFNAVAHLRGQQGSQGLPGPQGLPGQQGPAGPSADVTALTSRISAAEIKLSHLCPGKVVTSDLRLVPQQDSVVLRVLLTALETSGGIGPRAVRMGLPSPVRD
jgi:hypothetical protein